MPKTKTRALSDMRGFSIALLWVVVLFLVAFGLGMGRPSVSALAAAAGIFGSATIVITAVRRGERQWTRGLAEVISASDPPANASVDGRCEMELLVEIPGKGGPGDKTRYPQATFDMRVPLNKWPYPGQRVPVRVAAGDPTKVEVLWSKVHTDREMAAVDDLEDEYRDSAAPISAAQFVTAPPAPSTAPPASTRGRRDDIADLPLVPTPDPPSGPMPRRVEDLPLVEEPALVADPPPSVFPPTSPVSPAPPPRKPAPGPRHAAHDPNADPDAGSVAVLLNPNEVDHPVGVDDDPNTWTVIPVADPSYGRDTAATVSLFDTYLRTSRHDEPGPMGDEQDQAVILRVAALGRSVAFYQHHFGFEIVEGNATMASLERREVYLDLRQVSLPSRIEPRRLYLRIDVANLEYRYGLLRQVGVTFDHPPRIVARSRNLSLWAVTCRDPDGYGLALTEWAADA